MTHSCVTLHFLRYSPANLSNTGSGQSILSSFRVVNTIERNDFGALAPALEHAFAGCNAGIGAASNRPQGPQRIAGYNDDATTREKRRQDPRAMPDLGEDSHPCGIQVDEQRGVLIEEIQVGSLSSADQLACGQMKGFVSELRY